jgi:dienelactone hydrolase
MATQRGLIRATRGSWLRVFGCFVATLVALVWTGTSAEATIGDRYRVTNTYEFVNWDCGYPMRVTGVESDQVLVRTDKKLDGNVFVTNNFEIHETWTASDGRWFAVAANGLDKDVKAKALGGTLYEFTFNESGQPYTLTDSSGAVVYRDRGNLSFQYTIDLADGTFTFLGVRVSGPHPVFDVGACKAVAPLTGTDSARYLTPRPIGSTTFPMGYYEYLPPSYSNSGTQSPVLVALNGYGESGDGTPDGLRNLLNAGIPRFIDVGGWPAGRPLVVLALQHVDLGFDTTACDGVPWGGSCIMQLQHDRNHASPAFCTTPDEVHDFITYAVAHYNVDPKRVYITGLSCGAFGGWEYLAKYGDEHVAAAVLIAGEGRPAWGTAGCSLGSVPLWAFHGELDDVVNPQGSIEPMTNLAACPGVPADRARLTIYPGLFHEGWDQAYSGSLGDDIYTWMLAFSRP